MAMGECRDTGNAATWANALAIAGRAWRMSPGFRDRTAQGIAAVKNAAAKNLR